MGVMPDETEVGGRLSANMTDAKKGKVINVTVFLCFI